MSHRYQVTIQGKGFSTVPDEDGDGIVGFFAIRRVRADTPEEAYWTSARAIEREEKFQWLVESTREHTGSVPRHRSRVQASAMVIRHSCRPAACRTDLSAWKSATTAV